MSAIMRTLYIFKAFGLVDTGRKRIQRFNARCCAVLFLYQIFGFAYGSLKFASLPSEDSITAGLKSTSPPSEDSITAGLKSTSPPSEDSATGTKKEPPNWELPIIYVLGCPTAGFWLAVLGRTQQLDYFIMIIFLVELYLPVFILK